MSRLAPGGSQWLSNYLGVSLNPSDEVFENNDSINNIDKHDSSLINGDQDGAQCLSNLLNSRFCPYGCCKRDEIIDHVFSRGLLEGKYSDVTLQALGSEYKLHKLFLDKSGYFKSLFNWNEEDNDDVSEAKSFYSISFDDSYITKEAFELILSRLYGAPNHEMELRIPHNMIAVGSYLDVTDVICTSTEVIIQTMDMMNVSKYLKFATTNNYGLASDKIIDSAKGVLCSSGWEYGASHWDGIPESVIADVVGEDCFFVPNEWDRCMFIIKLIERRTTPIIQLDELDDESVVSTTSTIYDTPVALLRDVLREKVYYCHLSAEQLQQLSDLNDINGIPYINLPVLHEALWQSTSLQRSIVKSPDVPSLGLAISSDNEEVGIKNGWYRVPVRDETICGTPPLLKQLMSEHQYSFSNLDTTSSLNDGEFKATGDIEPTNAESKIFSWTKIPPFRFSIAFANASDLSTEKRVYAKTLWYAGSYWNLYLQKVKVKQKKGFQMGVYLHRASTPSSSSRNGLVNLDVYVNNINYAEPPIRFVDRQHAQSSALSALNNQRNETSDENDEKEIVDDDTLLSYLENLDLNELLNKEMKSNNTTMKQADTGNEQHPFTPTIHVDTTSQQNQKSFLCYDDTRSKISVYFVISTPSRRSKSTITSFVSAPDTFNKSQSWGWKSNSMCVFNEDGTFPEDHEKHLKFMVVLGNI